ncbi:MAG: HAMP domain-containing sensor histidine kinase [Chloroflexi bacterium]|nr:HAMP domain-containing sensor histidine kinase [Chloroflexota bacterium]
MVNLPKMISPELLVPRLGDQLVDMGLLSNEQLQQALAYQLNGMDKGQQLLLGQAIMELGFLDRATLDWAVTEQIMHLRTALEDANHNLELRVQQRTIELEEALRRLSESSQLKANIIANISHELRTPLTHVRGYLDLLYTESLGDLNSDQKKALGVSLQSSLRLQTLIDDLILFSQASRGQMTLTMGNVELKQVALKVFERFKTRADDHQLILQVNLEPDLPIVQADEEKIIWVITQLLDNAIKFSNPGGKVSLNIVKDTVANNMVTVSVSDTGIGISKDRIKEIFEPFHQLDGSVTRRYGGTGLGLTLVLQIIEAHGSIIDVQSEIDKGTTISFPLLDIKAA